MLDIARKEMKTDQGRIDLIGLLLLGALLMWHTWPATPLLGFTKITPQGVEVYLIDGSIIFILVLPTYLIASLLIVPRAPD